MSKHSRLISVAMATFNGERYLGEQLDSIASQTLRPDELVVSDDGSSDGTLEVLHSFAQRAAFTVTVTRNPGPRGYASNFNSALSQARGDVVLLSDQDDVWLPHKIETLVRWADAHPYTWVVMNDAALTRHDLSDTGLTKLGQIRSARLGDAAFVMGCCALIRRQLLDLCLPIPPECRSHDDWIIGIAHGLQCRHILPVVLQYYRRHDTNSSQAQVNRTTRIHGLPVPLLACRDFMTALLAALGPDSATAESKVTIEQLMLNWAKTVDCNVPSERLAAFRRFADSLQRRSDYWNARRCLRTLPLHKRVRAACDLFQHGVYQQARGPFGIVSFARDIIRPI